MFSRRIVPYVTTWSVETGTAPQVIANPVSGIAYADEALGERDEHGILWQRVPSLPGRGRPLFGQVHPRRQRRAMRRLLCQVCAGPADRTEHGVLWLLRDYRDDWPNWPERMAVTEPPICLACVSTSTQHCPALRMGYVTVRVGHSPVAGVRGALYRPGQPFPTAAADAIVTLDDPAVHWICASQLVRELRHCVIEET